MLSPERSNKNDWNSEAHCVRQRKSHARRIGNDFWISGIVSVEILNPTGVAFHFYVLGKHLGALDSRKKIIGCDLNFENNYKIEIHCTPCVVWWYTGWSAKPLPINFTKVVLKTETHTFFLSLLNKVEAIALEWITNLLDCSKTTIERWSTSHSWVSIHNLTNSNSFKFL